MSEAGTYLVAEYRHANVAFFVDTWVIYLGRERDLSIRR